MTQVAVLLLALAAPAADKEAPQEQKASPSARVTITAALACLHCTFGEGESCAVCLKLDDKTPVVLAGQVAKQFEEDRLSGKVVVVEGILALGKDKRLLLTSSNARLHSDKDKGKAPELGQARAVGAPCCGHCDLKLCDECTLAIVNARFPIVLDGKLAMQHADGIPEGKQVIVTGRPFVDKRGILRLEAKQVELADK
jgi:hypothetical protein